MKPKFKRLLPFLLSFALFINLSYAQQEVNTEFNDRMNFVFAPLEKYRVPHGLLLDYAMEFTNLNNSCKYTKMASSGNTNSVTIKLHEGG